MSKIGKKVNPIRRGAPIVSPAAPSAVISVEKNSFHIDSSSTFSSKVHSTLLDTSLSNYC